MELDYRLQILRDSGQLSEGNYILLLKIISMFDRKWGIKLTEENGSMFITHLSVALGRIEKGEKIDAVEENIYQEIAGNKNYDKCLGAIKDVEEELKIRIPENEKGFLMIYLCTLFQNE